MKQFQEVMKQENMSPNLLYRLKLTDAETEAGQINDENLVNLLHRFVRENITGGDESTMQNFLGKQL